jgi:hypothetical protein
MKYSFFFINLPQVVTFYIIYHIRSSVFEFFLIVIKLSSHLITIKTSLFCKSGFIRFYLTRLQNRLIFYEKILIIMLRVTILAV